MPSLKLTVENQVNNTLQRKGYRLGRNMAEGSYCKVKMLVARGNTILLEHTQTLFAVLASLFGQSFCRMAEMNVHVLENDGIFHQIGRRRKAMSETVQSTYSCSDQCSYH
uniref:Uncharacterized protein n=1 Tax=Timema bartmani TaxID=61472 RepID=A0A7R9ESK0_9NEOP|nr:unnamed protein product [Timema bartmani]